MADWDEIKRLAADFQRTQTSDTLQRLSERNCIDVVKKLTDLNLIELIYTCDGREFITPSHLSREIEDEIFINGGRMHLHDLASKLNVDYQHIENRCKELEKEKPFEYNLILGQLIHSSYKVTLGKQISDCMLVHGQLSIAEFAKSLDLPSEFLMTLVKEILSSVLDDFVVSQDERTYYTSEMIDRYKSIISGSLLAIVKPTTVASILKTLDIPERIFLPLVEGLIKDGRIDATIENRLLIPAIYAREQNHYINEFYSTNSYIEYDVLSRMDIKQPKALLKKKFPEGLQLKTCFISPTMSSQVEALIEECIASEGMIDISTIIPSSIESEDIELLLQDLFKKNKQFSSTCMIFDKTNVCSVGFIANCKKSLASSMHTRAQEHLKHGKLIDYFLGGRQRSSSRKEESESATSGNAEQLKDQSVGKKASEIEQEQSEVAKVNEENSESKKIVEDFDDDDDDGGRRSGRVSHKKDKKKKQQMSETHVEGGDSDDEQGGGKKGSKSGVKKGGGAGSQSREIRQKAVKKKYNPGGGKGGKANNNDVSDDEQQSSQPSKVPRSNKGRAARRAISPERPPVPSSSTTKSKQLPQRTQIPSDIEPLIFMHTQEIINKLRQESRECSEDVLAAIADLIKDDLNATYVTMAKETLDEFLKSQERQQDDEQLDDNLELVE